MGCNCKHNRQEILDTTKDFAELRNLFIKRMTVDSDHNDRRRKDFNQAIFHYEDKEEIDAWNMVCEKYGLPKKKYGRTYPVWNEIDIDMVLRCFDDAVKDWVKSWCDIEGCPGRTAKNIK